MEQFIFLIHSSNFDNSFEHINEFKSAVTDDQLEVNEVRIKWNQCLDLAKQFIMLLTAIPADLLVSKQSKIKN